MQPNRCIRIPWLILTLVLGAGCSIKKVAINKLGNALASGGTTFTSDEDPELVRDALPFSLKLIESLLAESPRHQGLLFAASSGFTPYAYAFVQEEADEVEAKVWRKPPRCGLGLASSTCAPAITGYEGWR